MSTTFLPAVNKNTYSLMNGCPSEQESSATRYAKLIRIELGVKYIVTYYHTSKNSVQVETWEKLKKDTMLMPKLRTPSNTFFNL